MFETIVDAPRLVRAAKDAHGKVLVYSSPIVDLSKSRVASPLRDYLDQVCWRIAGAYVFDDPMMWSGTGQLLILEIQESFSGDFYTSRSAFRALLLEVAE